MNARTPLRHRPSPEVPPSTRASWPGPGPFAGNRRRQRRPLGDLLRDRRILGLKFRRQQLVAGFIVDFYCASLRLVLELDGGVHDDPAQAQGDALRTRALSKRAIDVVRVRNDQVSEPSLRQRLAPYAETSKARGP